MLVLALAVDTPGRPPVRVVAEREQRRDVVVGDEPDVTATAAVATVRPAHRHRALPPEADAARATVAATDVQLALVDELRHRREAIPTAARIGRLA